MENADAFKKAMGNVISLSDREMVRQKDGSFKSDKRDKSNPINYRDEADRRGKMVIAMVEERKKLQDLILESCLKLEELGFECEAGPLGNCEEFLQIKSFARGVPHITRPSLESMPLHGVRGVKRIESHPEQDRVSVYLECGHIIEYSNDEYASADPKPTMQATVPCEICIAMLKEKGVYNAAWKSEV